MRVRLHIGRPGSGEGGALKPRQLVETQRAAELLGIDEALIAKWKHRRKVTPALMLHGRGRGGQVPLYDLEDLRPLAEAYKARQARRAARHAEDETR